MNGFRGIFRSYRQYISETVCALERTKCYVYLKQVVPRVMAIVFAAITLAVFHHVERNQTCVSFVCLDNLIVNKIALHRYLLFARSTLGIPRVNSTVMSISCFGTYLYFFIALEVLKF